MRSLQTHLLHSTTNYYLFELVTFLNEQMGEVYLVNPRYSKTNALEGVRKHIQVNECVCIVCCFPLKSPFISLPCCCCPWGLMCMDWINGFSWLLVFDTVCQWGLWQKLEKVEHLWAWASCWRSLHASSSPPQKVTVLPLVTHYIDSSFQVNLALKMWTALKSFHFPCVSKSL